MVQPPETPSKQIGTGGHTIVNSPSTGSEALTSGRRKGGAIPDRSRSRRNHHYYRICSGKINVLRNSQIHCFLNEIPVPVKAVGRRGIIRGGAAQSQPSEVRYERPIHFAVGNIVEEVFGLRRNDVKELLRCL
jgi:hypothetical protein